MGHRPEQGAAPADYVVVGASHKTSSAALRDRLFIEDADVPEVLAALRKGGFDQALVVSTCDRVEFHGAAVDPDRAVGVAREILGRRAGSAGHADGEFFQLMGADAARHVFAVAASLESVVVGESEVLGQLKTAHALARDSGGVGRELESLMQHAYGAAKDVRSNTAIAEGPVSLATAAVQAARNLFGSLEDVSALLIGPAEMGMLMLDQFRSGGLRRVTVAASNAARGQALARIVEGHSVTYDDIPAALVGSDLVIGAAGIGRPMITAAMLQDALRARRRKPIFVLDVAIPNDADPDIAGLEDAFLYDLDHLESISRSNRQSRDAAMAEAWQTIDRHITMFQDSRAERDAVPVVADLRAHFDAVRAETLSDHPHGDADEITRRLINRLLHTPSLTLRTAARDEGADSSIAKAARRMFGLTPDKQETQDEPETDGTASSGSEDQ
ncbi:MAG: glutamyl-tRNA reductase [Rhodospirillaceae bacterium]|jgi:glutamyl-tRNA reductase|nr:glutamyl-tRNA reductase [Rhodospirillaceae bacterium]MBT5944997.1 glutamyl-tRNA reductase [Rhodospirillaceae bacterium]MBT6403554.1 glutamyl-tRNA reductase [Rhodospirillaceae bacterium]MBT6535489.1 glutamyl-tRNA reductase [Rhodospirillaceae bacterium]MBT7360794.1 glutamyl-tRNA reductase [Rhodospirillaceae bacterium]